MVAPTPRSIVWEVTARCDLRCGHCYNVWTAPGATAPIDLDRETALGIPGRLASLGRGLQVINLTGGEPLLRQDLVDIVARCREALPKVRVNVATNGRRLTAAYARALANAGADAIQLTLLGPSPDGHDRLTGVRGSFDSTIAAIANAKAADRAVAVFFVALRENIDDFPGTAKLARAVGADAIVFNRFQPGGRGLVGWHERNPTPRQLARALDRLKEVRRFVDVTFGTMLPPCESGDRSKLVPEMICPIGTPNAYPTIGPDGSLRACNHRQEALGSVLDPEFTDLLRDVDGCRSSRPPECGACSSWDQCHGGCPAARDLAGERIYACSGG